jgi:hypothetical protein
MMGGKKKQFLPVITSETVEIDEVEYEKPINKVERYTRFLARVEVNGEEVDLYEPPVNYGMIGWDGKKFNGIELEAPELKMMIPAWYPSQAMCFTFFKRLMEFVGTVNSKKFYGMNPGECKYLGPEQSWVTRVVKMNDDDETPKMLRVMELQHHFQVQLEQEDVDVGGGIIVDKIPGWDYPDVHYEETLIEFSDGKKFPIAIPKQVDIVPVYKRKDFWELFDGTIIEDLWEGSVEDLLEVPPL